MELKYCCSLYQRNVFVGIDIEWVQNSKELFKNQIVSISQWTLFKNKNMQRYQKEY